MTDERGTIDEALRRRLRKDERRRRREQRRRDRIDRIRQRARLKRAER